jgi:hydrogenase nickel incorporation protein HypA/HybF
MHELSIALSILDVVEEQASQQEGRVAAIHLRLGPLSGVVKEALLSSYEMAREGTPLAQAELMIEEMPLVIRCSVCAEDRTIASAQSFCCPVCGTPSADIVSGRELEVFAFEIES